ncbi:hypothetical protein [Cerasicoccus fimbriatus]|uniref:hypothetical protein n=1 Tax=Cerasicoccus fimbriatus TaxID=3014554 RepID=UPI0022B384F5|nr:hypothetical protein [Cerasicoccus sp. TK19100]
MSLKSPLEVSQHLNLPQPYEAVAGQWTPERAKAWYDRLPWLAGTNYYPATAINQLEMWQRDMWDPARIKLEMQWSQELGFNTHRVYLHDLVWEADADGLYARMDEFLDICAAHGVRPFFVFFDDCHSPFPKLGEQPLPVPAYHNSGWVTSPARADALAFAAGQASEAVVNRLKGYVQQTLQRFAHDDRVLMWELYNEPGRGAGTVEDANAGNLEAHDFADASAPLVHESWVWAREVNPSQPICSNSEGCVGDINWSISVINSDVHSIHHYGNRDKVSELLDQFEQFDRPLFMTEYLARKTNSTFEEVMPLLKERRVAAINWGFVAGKSGTIWPWNSRERDGAYRTATSLRAKGDVVEKVEDLPEPDLWFHDILRYDGTPYREEETACIRSLTKG